VNTTVASGTAAAATPKRGVVRDSRAMSERSEISRVFSRGVEEHMDTLYGVGVG
jgi:hypothetical protein